MQKTHCKIGITLGDPKGIGLEITIKAFRLLPDGIKDKIVIYGDDNLLSHLDIDIDRNRLISTSETFSGMAKTTDEDAGKIALAALNRSIDDARRGNISAIVTSPVNKARIRLIDPEFTGHTDHLEKCTDTKRSTMVFSTDSICISIATRHVALRNVPKNLDFNLLTTTIEDTCSLIKKLHKMDKPRIAVMSLNPHAGEASAFGDEEERIIVPAVDSSRSDGIDCTGPLPADAIFNDLKTIPFDGIVAIYHDQGMIPVKLIGGTSCVNITHGLPFIRTSPGHGTAEGIAWKDKASEGGMLNAILVADRLFSM